MPGLTASRHVHRALAIFEQHDLVIGMVKVCSNLGAVHAVKSENAVAQTYMYRSLELAERISNYPIIALSSGNLGEVAARAGDSAARPGEPVGCSGMYTPFPCYCAINEELTKYWRSTCRISRLACSSSQHRL